MNHPHPSSKMVQHFHPGSTSPHYTKDTDLTFFKVTATFHGAELEYFTQAKTALEAIDRVADTIENRDYTWCDIDYVSKGFASKTMDVGAGAYRFTAGSIVVI